MELFYRFSVVVAIVGTLILPVVQTMCTILKGAFRQNRKKIP